MAVTYRPRASEAVPSRTRLTGRLMLLTEAFSSEVELPVRVKKTRLTK